jgi:small ligand-binding sensory domain FIST
MGLAEAKAAVPRASGGVVFVSGALGQDLAAVVDRVRAEWRGVPVAIVPAAGVITEKGEVEGSSAAAGMIWPGGGATPFAVPDDPADLGLALAETLGGAVDGRVATALLFARPDGFQPSALDAVAAVAPRLCLFGAGTSGGGAIAISGDGEVHRGRIAGLVLTGLAAPVADASPACRLLGSFEPIEEVDGGMVLRIGGRPALDVLSSCAAELGGPGGEASPRPLVLAAIADEAAREPELDTGLGGDTPHPSASAPQERFIVRAVRGIDPARRGVMVGPEARPGARFAFAVRDAAAARAHLEATARRVSKLALGAVPRFAIYLSCAGRGQGLYGAPDVESRILRQRFGDLPIAGMHSSFEIAPWGPGSARMQLYTGVLALFRSPS